jgi:flagellin
MGRINTNVAALISQHRLGKSQKNLNTTLERLSSGLRINRGADDPAGLIASETLRSEISGVTQAIDNSQRASNVIATAEGSLNEVAALLVDIQKLIVQAANTGAMSPEEIDANQLQINSAVEAISRIANTTTFAGRPLLDGSLDYVTSGVHASAITALQINRASFGTHDYIPVQVDVTQSAQQAALYFLASNTATSAITIEVKGSNGVATVVLGSASPTSAIVRAINNQSDVTGVIAEYINSAAPASGVVIHSFDYGSDVIVSVKAISGGAFVLQDLPVGGVTRDADTGQDAEATINGHLSTGRGLNLVMNTSELEMTLRLADDFGIGSTDFAITGGGALFQLGPSVNTNQQVNIGIQSVAASRLGDPIVGYLNQIVEGGQYALRKPNGPHQAGLIVNQAIKQVSGLRGRLGSFERNTLDTNVNALNITMENLTSAESVIRDADFAQETANLTRSQILVQAGTSVLSIANTTPQSVLSLLGGR